MPDGSESGTRAPPPSAATAAGAEDDAATAAGAAATAATTDAFATYRARAGPTFFDPSNFTVLLTYLVM